MRHDSRRGFLKSALLGGALVPALALIGTESHAADLAPLDPDEPNAKAFGFVTDAGKVDAKAETTFKPGQHCGVCTQYQGKPGDARGGCNIFPDKTVPATGWCKVWTPR
jgi:hypothetical protein